MSWDYAIEVIEYSEAVMKQRELTEIELEELKRALQITD